jgi:hypothetical protein
MSSELRRLFVGLILIASVVAVFRQPELAGDPAIYRSRMALLFDGEIPYLDFFFEHLPLVIAPMGTAWLLGGAFSPVAYTVVFAGLMALCLLLTVTHVQRLGEALDLHGAGRRWLTVAGPLFPFILFRSDPFPVVLTVMAMHAMVEGKERRAAWLQYAGVMAKGWPTVLALPEWWRGRRWKAAGLIAATAALLAGLIALPGFSQARQFSGIHSETVVGGFFTLARLRTGSSLALINEAGATYVAVSVWATVLNLTLGILLIGVAVFRLGAFSWEDTVRLLSAVVVALLIGSPLLSPQFILWGTPFLALHPERTVRATAFTVSALTLVYMLGWNPGFQGDLWWVGVVNLRNVVLVVLGVMTALAVSGARIASDERGRP